MLSSKTEFFVDISGQISSRHRQLSTKQWSRNKCSDVQSFQTKIQTSSYAIDQRDWPGKQWRAECQACPCTRLTARFLFLQKVKPFWRLILSIFCLLNVSFLFQNSTLCRQNRIFVDMLYFLKIAVLLPISSTTRLSTTALMPRQIFCPVSAPVLIWLVTYRTSLLQRPVLPQEYEELVKESHDGGQWVNGPTSNNNRSEREIRGWGKAGLALQGRGLSSRSSTLYRPLA